MRRADAGQSPGDDPATLGNKLREQTNVLVIDSLNLFDAEFADFFAAKIFAAATTPAGGPYPVAEVSTAGLPAGPVVTVISVAFGPGVALPGSGSG